MTPEQRSKKLASLKVWKLKNKEHIRQYKATRGKEKNAEYRERNREKLRERQRAYYAKNKEEIRRKAKIASDLIPVDVKRKQYAERYLREKAILNARSKTYAEANKEKVKMFCASWKKRNSDKVRAYSMKRIAIKNRAIPKWADLNAIEDVYSEAVYMQMQVDHIVPLQSKIVCGLHVVDNLQLLTARENIIKGNRCWPDMP